MCKPLALSSVRQCHAVLSGALSAAQRWGWITVNPLEAVQRPRMPAPQPDPPSSGEAVKIVNAAWDQDEDWGTFVWLTLVTGARRGELRALIWGDVDFAASVLTIRRNLVSHNGQTIVKDTKTRQMRRRWKFSMRIGSDVLRAARPSAPCWTIILSSSPTRRIGGDHATRALSRIVTQE